MKKYLKKRSKTKKLLINTALKLGEKDGLLNITTTEIIYHAHVNRKTFYRYFNNKSELIHYIEDQILNKIKHAHAKLYKTHNLKRDLFNENSKGLLKLFNIISMNRRIINLLLSKNGDPRFNHYLLLLFQKMVINAQDRYFNQLTPKEKKLTLTLF